MPIDARQLTPVICCAGGLAVLASYLLVSATQVNK
jgi:hypothetical protein